MTAGTQSSRFPVGLAAYAAASADLVALATREGELLDVNPAGLRLIGIANRADAQGMKLSALFPENRRINVQSIVTTVVRTRVHWQGDVQLRRATDGEAVALSLDVFVMEDGPDGTPCLAITGRDIRERLRSSTALQLRADAAQRLREIKNAMRADVSAALVTEAQQQPALQACCEALVRNLGVAFARIWIVDGTEQVLTLEASAGMYTHRDGAHGRVPVGKFKIGQIAAQRQAHLTNAVIGDSRVPEQAWAQREGLVTFAGYPLVAGDRLLGVMAMFSRQTMDEETFDALASVAELIAHNLRRRSAELRLIEQAAHLQRVNGELEQYTYIASHDLQEPLRTVSNYLDMLQRRSAALLDEKAQRYIRYAGEAAMRMQALIKDLLTFSRTDHEAAAALEEVPARECVHKALENLDSAIVETQATISIEELPVVRYHRLHLCQLFQNLIGNALKYRGPDPPRIHISATATATEWTFAVRDNGIGIDPAYHQRIFDVFQRLHKRGEYAGTGIGLALCRKITTMHGGAIRVDSVPGGGSTFSFTVPKAYSDRGP